MRWICFIFFWIFFVSAKGQGSYSLSGTVKDEGKQPLEGITVRLLSVKDSTFLVGAVTDSKGHFLLETTKQECLLRISCIGYQSKLEKIRFEKKKKSLDLGDILLEEKAVTLEGVTVKGRIPPISVRGDTLEYNADSYRVPEYASVKDLLKILPNVTVSSEGKITVQGEVVKKILVEGKELFSGDGELTSKTLPAKMVDKLQVFKKSSDADRLSGIDSGDKETVINLTIKEKMKVSVLTQLTAGVGRELRDDSYRHTVEGNVNVMNNQNFYSLRVEEGNLGNGMGRSSYGEEKSREAAFSFNQQLSKKLSLNGTLRYSFRQDDVDRSSSVQTFLSPENPLIEDKDGRNHQINRPLNFDAHGEWKPNEQHTLIFRTSLSHTQNQSEQLEGFGSFNAVRDTLYNGNSKSENRGKDLTLRVSLDYGYRFRKKGRILSASFEGYLRKGNSTEIYDWKSRLFNEGSYERDSLFKRQSTTNNLSHSMRYYVSYVEPAGEKNSLQLSYSVEWQDGENKKSAYRMRDFVPLEEVLLYLDSLQSNGTLQNSANQRFTVNFQSRREKLDYTLGLALNLKHEVNKNYRPSRAMIADFPTFQDGAELPNRMGDSLYSAMNQNYMDVSPSARFRYKIGTHCDFNASYSGRMSSPTARQTRDYTDVSNPLYSIKGNPDLKPSYRNSMSMSYMKSNPEKASYHSFSLYANYALNSIKNVSFLDPETGHRLTTYRNITGDWDLRLSNTFDYSFGKEKKFSVGNSVSFSYGREKGFTNGSTNVTTPLRVELNPQFRYSLKKLWLSVRGSVRYSDTRGNVSSTGNLRLFDYGANGRVNWELPWQLTIESDLDWTLKSGYGDSGDYSETMWNVSLSRSLFTGKYGKGTLRISAYDILQEQKNFSRYVGDNYVVDTRTSFMGSYYMCSFIYNFNLFPNEQTNHTDKPD